MITHSPRRIPSPATTSGLTLRLGACAIASFQRSSSAAGTTSWAAVDADNWPSATRTAPVKQQRIHLRLAAKDARGDPESQPNHLAFDLGEIALALAGEAVDQLGCLAQPLPLGCDHASGLCFALGLTTLDAASLPSHLKGAASLLGQTAIEFETHGFRGFAMCIVHGLGIRGRLSESSYVRRRGARAGARA